MEYNKLVRDKIPRIIREDGKNPIMHVADDEEFLNRLKEKLREEVDEFLKDDKLDELIDIFEVMMTISGLNGWDFQRFLENRDKKIKERGAFEKRIILERVE